MQENGVYKEQYDTHEPETGCCNSRSDPHGRKTRIVGLQMEGLLFEFLNEFLNGFQVFECVGLQVFE